MQYRAEERFMTLFTIFSTIAIVVACMGLYGLAAFIAEVKFKEIGIRKVLGASDLDIIIECIVESAFIGFIGGILGLGAGAVVAFFLNTKTADEGILIFAVTGRIIFAVPIFATLLSSLAGLYPALKAARNNPVVSLKTY